MGRGHRKVLPYNPRLRPLARALRKQGILGEVLLWGALQRKALGCEFHRQVPIGECIVDFFCPERMLAVEVDGSSHDHTEAWEKDVQRQTALEAMGIRFLRFRETEVRGNLAGVVETIRDWLERDGETEG